MQEFSIGDKVTIRVHIESFLLKCRDLNRLSNFYSMQIILCHNKCTALFGSPTTTTATIVTISNRKDRCYNAR